MNQAFDFGVWDRLGWTGQDVSVDCDVLLDSFYVAEASRKDWCYPMRPRVDIRRNGKSLWVAYRLDRVKF